MKIDAHFHVAGNGTDLNNVDNDIYFKAEDNNHWFTRILYNMLEEDLENQGVTQRKRCVALLPLQPSHRRIVLHQIPKL